MFITARRYASAAFAVVVRLSLRHNPVLYWILEMPTEFYFEIQYFSFDYNHTSSQSQKHSTVTNQIQISVFQSQIQQPIVPI